MTITTNLLRRHVAQVSTMAPAIRHFHFIWTFIFRRSKVTKFCSTCNTIKQYVGWLNPTVDDIGRMNTLQCQRNISAYSGYFA